MQSSTLNAQALDNRDQGLVQSEATLTLHTQGFVNNAGGTLASRNVLSLTSTGLANQQGRLLGSAVAINTQQAALENTDGQIASTTDTLTLHSGALTNTGGLLQAATALTLNTYGQALINTASGTKGGILSGTTLRLDTGAFNNHTGLLHSQGQLTGRLGTLDNRQGQFGAHASLALTSLAIQNQHGQLHHPPIPSEWGLHGLCDRHP